MSRQRTGLAIGLGLACLALCGARARADIGSAMIYGPYTGGHGYSYAEAYHYMLPFTSNGFSSPWMYPYDWSSYPYRGYHFPEPRPIFPCLHGRRRQMDDEPPPVAAPVAPAPAVVNVQVPASAELWFDGNKTAQTGSERRFVSPPLPAGKTFHYSVRVRWTDNGKPVDQIQMVNVQAGGQARLLFSQP